MNRSLVSLPRPLAVTDGAAVIALAATGCVVTPEQLEALKQFREDNLARNSHVGEESATTDEPMFVAAQHGEEWGFAPQGTVSDLEPPADIPVAGHLVGLVVDVARISGSSPTSHTGFTFALVGTDEKLYDPGTAAEVAEPNDYYTLKFPTPGAVEKDATVIVQLPQDVDPGYWVLMDERGEVLEEFPL